MLATVQFPPHSLPCPKIPTAKKHSSANQPLERLTLPGVRPVSRTPEGWVPCFRGPIMSSGFRKNRDGAAKACKQTEPRRITVIENGAGPSRPSGSSNRLAVVLVPGFTRGKRTWPWLWIRRWNLSAWLGCFPGPNKVWGKSFERGTGRENMAPGDFPDLIRQCQKVSCGMKGDRDNVF